MSKDDDLLGSASALRAVVAAAIRAAVPDEEACVADEDECFRRHRIHTMSSVNGVVESVCADVEAVAAMAVDALASAGLLLPEGAETRIETEVSWLSEWYQRRVKALEELLVRYRLGQQPSERLFRELEVTGKRIDSTGAWRGEVS